MKKFLLAFLTVLLITSCSGKKKNIEGVRRYVFQSGNDLTISRKNIVISPAKTFNSFFGDNSPLNDDIENYRVNSFNFSTHRLSTKKVKTSYKISSPLIVGSVIYTMDARGNLHAINRENPNRTLWKKRVIEKYSVTNYYMGKISYYNDKIFITNRLNEVIAVSTDGDILWRKKLNAIPISSPIAYDNTIFVITNDNRLYSLNSDDGNIKWIHYGSSKDSAVLGSANPVIHDNYVIASYSSGELFVLDRSTGNVVFSHNLTGKSSLFSNFELTDIDSTPVIKNNILIATSNIGSATAIDLNNFSILWKKPLPSLTNTVINGENAFIITNENLLVAVDIHSGNVSWTKEFDRFKNIQKRKNLIFYRSLFMANGDLYAINSEKQLIRIDAKTGNLLNTTKLSFNNYSNIYSSNGKLYFIGYRGVNAILVISD